MGNSNMNRRVTTSGPQQTPTVGRRTLASEKSRRNVARENHEDERDYSFNDVAIITAAPTTHRQRQRLYEMEAKKEPMSPIQKATIKRAKHEDFYCVPVTPAVLEFDDGGKGRKHFELFQSLAFPITYERCLAELASANHDDECNLHFLKIGFLKGSGAAAGIFDLSSDRFRVDALYRPKSLQRFIDFVGSRPEVFIMLFNREINQNLNEDPISQLGALLNMVGLRQIPLKSTEADGEVWYKLDEERLNLLMEMMHARFSEPGMLDEPPEYWENEEPVDWEAAMKNWIPE